MSNAEENKTGRAVVYISPALHKQIKVLAATRETTMQELIEAAVRATYKHLLRSGAAR